MVTFQMITECLQTSLTSKNLISAKPLHAKLSMNINTKTNYNVGFIVCFNNKMWSEFTKHDFLNTCEH